MLLTKNQNFHKPLKNFQKLSGLKGLFLVANDCDSDSAKFFSIFVMVFAGISLNYYPIVESSPKRAFYVYFLHI